MYFIRMGLGLSCNHRSTGTANPVGSCQHPSLQPGTGCPQDLPSWGPLGFGYISRHILPKAASGA